MKVEITIPSSIVNTCVGCGWNEKQTEAVFLSYLNEITSHPYNQFEIDFENWIQDEDCIDEILEKNN
jgi:hypothetical protein